MVFTTPAVRMHLAARTLLGVFLALGVAAPLAARDLTYRDRNDRIEGVIVEQDISGGQIELVGVRRDMAVPVVAAGGKVTLAFWMDAPRDLEISVRQYRKNYWMVPHQKHWQPGWQSFAWDRAEVIDELSLQPADLNVLIRDAGSGTYYPGVLSVGEPIDGPERYRFDFHVRGGLDATCRVVRLGDAGAQELWSKTLERDASGMVSIFWDGTDKAGARVAAGPLYLRLTGYLVLTNRDEEFVREVPFYHGGGRE